MMRLLLYPLVKFGIIIYDNELPGKPRAAGANISENAEDARQGSTPESFAPETVTLAVPCIALQSAVIQTAAVDVHESFAPENVAPKPATSTTVREELAYGHHVLFGRPVACDQKRTNIETTPSTPNLSVQVNGANSKDSSSSPTTLVNTPTNHSALAKAEEENSTSILSGKEVILEQSQSCDTPDQTQEQNVLSTIPADALEHTEDHGSSATQIDKTTAGPPQYAAATPTTIAQKTPLSAEIRAHRRARRQLAILKAIIITREDQLRMIQDRLRQAADKQDRLRKQDHLSCIDPRLF